MFIKNDDNDDRQPKKKLKKEPTIASKQEEMVKSLRLKFIHICDKCNKRRYCTKWASAIILKCDDFQKRNIHK